jgi:beta-glucosidase
MSCRFDPGLSAARRALVRAEQAAKGAAVDLGPTVNIDRDPRWGRELESLSED